jgi:hypothetical protein
MLPLAIEHEYRQWNNIEADAKASVDYWKQRREEYVRLGNINKVKQIDRNIEGINSFCQIVRNRIEKNIRPGISGHIEIPWAKQMPHEKPQTPEAMLVSPSMIPDMRPAEQIEQLKTGRKNGKSKDNNQAKKNVKPAVFT